MVMSVIIIIISYRPHIFNEIFAKENDKCIVCVFALLQPHMLSLRDILEVDNDIVFPLVIFHLGTKADSRNAYFDCK